MTQTQPTVDALVRAGGEALRGGERTRARQLLAQAVRADPSSQQAWLLLAGAVTDSEQRRSCLERVLRLNPDHAIARKVLGALPAATPETPAPQTPARLAEAATKVLAPAPTSVQRAEGGPPDGAARQPVAESPLTSGLTSGVADPARATPAVRTFEELTLVAPAPVAPALPVAPPGPLAAPVAVPTPQYTLPLELVGDEARRRSHERRLWVAVLVVGLVLLLAGSGLALLVIFTA